MSNKAKPSRIYLPRTTSAMSSIIVIEQIAKEKGVSFGRVVDLLVLESATFTKKFEELKKDAPWLED